MNGSKVAAIPCGRTTIAQSNCRQLIGLRPGFASSIKRQRIQLNRTASIGPGSLPLLAKRNGRRCMKSSHLTMVAGACNHPNLLVLPFAFHWFVLLPSDVAAAVTVEKSIEKGSFYAQADPRLNHFNE